MPDALGFTRRPFVLGMAAGGGAQGLKDDRGGNVIAIATFTEARSGGLVVGNGVKRLKIADRGGAEYIYDAMVGATYLAAYPQSSFATFDEHGNARGFRLDEKIVLATHYGAIGDGSTDDTNALAAAIAALTSGGGGDLLLPFGNYRVTSKIAVGTAPIRLRGQGKGRSVIAFAPTADGTCLEFGGGTSPAYNQGLTDLTVTSADATYAKVLVNLRDCSRFLMQDVDLRGSVSNGLSSYLFGGAGGSICLKTNGRDLSTFSRCTFTGQRPIVIAPNANSSIAADHYVFRDLYLLGSLGTGAYATSYPLVEIQQSPGAGAGFPYSTDISDLSFGGSQAWVGGGYGLYWSDTAATDVSLAVLIENVRREQAQAIDKQMVYVNKPGGVQGFTVRNFYGGGANAAGAGVPGFLFRGVSKLLIEGYEYTGLDPTKSPLDVDATVRSTTAHGVSTQPGMLLMLAGQQRLTFGVGYPNPNIPDSFELATTAFAGLRLSDVFQSGPVITVASGATAIIGPNSLIGMIHVCTSIGTSALFNLLGTNNLTQEVSDPAGHFSSVSGTGSSTNIYYSGGNYILQNNIGRTIKYRITGFGAGSAGF